MSETPAPVWPQVGQLIRVLNTGIGETGGVLGIVVHHPPGRVPVVLTTSGPIVGIGARFDRDASVIDLIAGLDRLVLPVPVKVHVCCTKRCLISCRAAVWTANRRKTAKMTEITAQADAEIEEPEAAIYSVWTLFSMRFARFAKKQGITYAVPEARVEVGRKPLATGRLTWNDKGYRHASSWFERTNDRLLHRSFEDVLATGKAVVESKAIGLVTQDT